MRKLIVGIAVAAVLAYAAYYLLHTREGYARPDALLTRIAAQLEVVDPRVRDLAFYRDNKSFTVNKRKVHICMKDENDEYYPENFLKYVVLHEVAHAVCGSVGHTDEFARIFQDLLQRAHALGVYDMTQPHVENYCGYK